MSMGAAVFFVVLVIGLMIAVTVYNNLVALARQTDRAWTNIEILLKQRFEEIPQIIEVVEQYAAYEQQTLQRVMEARKTYSQAETLDSKMQASNEMSLALKGVVALGESY